MKIKQKFLDKGNKILYSNTMTYILVDTANTFFRARHVVRGDLDTKVGMAFHITLGILSEGHFHIVSPRKNSIRHDTLLFFLSLCRPSGFFLNGPIHPQKKVNMGSNAINNLNIKADSLDQY